MEGLKKPIDWLWAILIACILLLFFLVFRDTTPQLECEWFYTNNTDDDICREEYNITDANECFNFLLYKKCVEKYNITDEEECYEFIYPMYSEHPHMDCAVYVCS